jgi:hypothetical protein
MQERSVIISFLLLPCSELAVNAVMRLKKSGNLQAIQIIKILGGRLKDS